MKTTMDFIAEIEQHPPVPVDADQKDVITEMMDTLNHCRLKNVLPRHELVKVMRHGLWLLYLSEQQEMQAARTRQSKFFIAGDHYGRDAQGNVRPHREWLPWVIDDGLDITSIILGHIDTRDGIFLYNWNDEGLSLGFLRWALSRLHKLQSVWDLPLAASVYNGKHYLGSLGDLK